MSSEGRPQPRKAAQVRKPTNPDPATMSPQDAQKALATNLTTYAGGKRLKSGYAGKHMCAHAA
jgi:hypothetical protein